MTVVLQLLLLIVTLSLSLSSGADTTSAALASEVLAQSSTARLTREDAETELRRLPADMRAAFFSDPKRVSGLLNNLLLMKMLAARARADKVDQEPATQERIRLEMDRLLSQLAIERTDAAANAEFDAKIEEFNAQAAEIYRVDTAKYQIPETISASHILFVKARGLDNALSAAREARAKLVAGADFEEIAASSSDDPSAKRNRGHLGWFAAEKMDPAFSKAAFALHSVGDISEPVLSSYGYHIIKLEGRRPGQAKSFQEVKPQILAELRGKFVAGYRERVIAGIRNDPSIRANQPAIDAWIKQAAAEAPVPVPSGGASPGAQ